MKLLQWENYECEFTTRNTVNSFGNSTYYVWKNGVFRHAPVNSAPERWGVESTNNYIAYLAPADYDVFKNHPETHILGCDNFHIFALVSNVSSSAQIRLRREPERLFRPFDFSLTGNGRTTQVTIAGQHMGHEIIDINPGKPSRAKPFALRSRRCQIL